MYFYIMWLCFLMMVVCTYADNEEKTMNLNANSKNNVKNAELV